MNRLFSLSVRRISLHLGVEELAVKDISKLLEDKGIGKQGEGMLYRLPREELKHIFNIPCPVNKYQYELFLVWNQRTVKLSLSLLRD